MSAPRASRPARSSARHRTGIAHRDACLTNCFRSRPPPGGRLRCVCPTSEPRCPDPGRALMDAPQGEGGRPRVQEPASFSGEADHLAAGSCTGLADRGAQVVADRARRQEDRGGDVRDRAAVFRSHQDIALARGQRALPRRERLDGKSRVRQDNANPVSPAEVIPAAAHHRPAAQEHARTSHHVTDLAPALGQLCCRWEAREQ